MFEKVPDLKPNDSRTEFSATNMRGAAEGRRLFSYVGESDALWLFPSVPVFCVLLL